MAVGFALIALGAGGLVWSHALTPGWWQGTLQALGVGLAIGGLVDVLAISGLNRIISDAEARRQQALRDLTARAKLAVASGDRAAMEEFVINNLGQLKDIDLDIRAVLLRR